MQYYITTKNILQTVS